MKKAQAFTQDLIIAVVIITMMILIFFSFYTNQNIGTENIENNVMSETKTITDYLTTKGYPDDWNSTNVVRIGFTDNDYTLMLGKLELFSNMTRDDYDKARTLLKTKYDYIIFFTDYNGNVLNITNQKFIGKQGINNTNIESLESPTHISSITRFVVLRDNNNSSVRIIEMVTYVWSKER